ncbi:hypothetical protein [Pseudooceanicola nanhaiensis]|nr:hypothetical protein [Pseudooceanicola nanhaiensis]
MVPTKWAFDIDESKERARRLARQRRQLLKQQVMGNDQAEGAIGGKMRIPVFVSSPTKLNDQQEKSRGVVLEILNELQLEPRALGRSDYPKDVPLKEVYAIARHCHGGVILGYEQFVATSGIWKRGTAEEIKVSRSGSVSFPTPWNQLKAGILFGLRLPLLIFRERDVFGGVFDVGTTEVFVHETPPDNPTQSQRGEIKEVFLKWYSQVSRNYYAD